MWRRRWHMLSVCSSGVKSLTPLCVCVRACVRAHVRGRWTVLNHVPRAPSLLLNCRRAQQLLLVREYAHVHTHVEFKTRSAYPAAKQQAPLNTRLRAWLCLQQPLIRLYSELRELPVRDSCVLQAGVKPLLLGCWRFIYHFGIRQREPGHWCLPTVWGRMENNHFRFRFSKLG